MSVTHLLRKIFFNNISGCVLKITPEEMWDKCIGNVQLTYEKHFIFNSIRPKRVVKSPTHRYSW